MYTLLLLPGNIPFEPCIQEETRKKAMSIQLNEKSFELCMKDFLWRFCIPFPEKEKKNEMNCTLKQNQFTSRKHICPKRCVHIPLPRALTPSSPLSFPVASGGEHKSDNQHWGSRGLRWLWTRFDWPSGMLCSLHIWPYSSLALAV